MEHVIDCDMHYTEPTRSESLGAERVGRLVANIGYEPALWAVEIDDVAEEQRLTPPAWASVA